MGEIIWLYKTTVKEQDIKLATYLYAYCSM